MLVFLIRRLLQSAVVLLVMSLVVFTGVFAIGNPVDSLINPEATEQQREKTISQLGLDKPLHEQYFIFLQNAVKGELGTSFVHNRPAIKLILERLPATLELTISALFIAILFGIPLGLAAGLNPDGLIGRTISSGSILFFSVPTFWAGLMLIMVFSVQLNWLPTTGRGETVDLWGFRTSLLTLDGLRHLILPAVNLGLYPLALIIRLTASGVQETMPLEFMKFARAKGLRKSRIISVHLMKNILIPIVTVIGLQFSVLLAFAVVTETIFAWPGMGRLIIESINLLDRPVIVAYLLVVVTVFMVVNILVDIVYSYLDPRIRIGSM
ncbi:ABC transporter permease [Hoeflea sp. WL0058]|uniref:ABC transporter permease n=1 Tax=Flavimaribacter sediminis TaxID=2865987 RepID=A0AAE2ZG02_9HYPH|nr:ABC transporter permease [Flavimaribacter sediminis]MBW8635854.1 ABC transporter permease [Flavimaribacter sediminis]